MPLGLTDSAETFSTSKSRRHASVASSIFNDLREGGDISAAKEGGMRGGAGGRDSVSSHRAGYWSLAGVQPPVVRVLVWLMVQPGRETKNGARARIQPPRHPELRVLALAGPTSASSGRKGGHLFNIASSCDEVPPECVVGAILLLSTIEHRELGLQGCAQLPHKVLGGRRDGRHRGTSLLCPGAQLPKVDFSSKVDKFDHQMILTSRKGKRGLRRALPLGTVQAPLPRVLYPSPVSRE